MLVEGVTVPVKASIVRPADELYDPPKYAPVPVSVTVFVPA